MNELVEEENPIEKILIQITTKEKETMELKKTLEEVMSNYEKKFPDMMSRLLDLNFSIREKEIEIGKITNTTVNSSQILQKSESKSKELKGCKSLFKKIARECHPDVTNGDEELTKIFLKAKKFLTLGNYTGLINLLNSLDNGIKIVDILDEDSLEYLKRSLKEKTQELSVLKSSLAYKLKSFEENCSVGRGDILFCQLITSEMLEKYKELKSLEIKIKILRGV